MRLEIKDVRTKEGMEVREVNLNGKRITEKREEER